MTNIIMKKADTLSFGVKIEGLDGDVLSAATFAVKRQKGDDDVVIQKTLENGITQSEDEEDTYVVRLSPSDTENIEADVYVYDLEVRIGTDTTISNSQDRFTVMDGRLTIREK
jgi:hypothetical protein